MTSIPRKIFQTYKSQAAVQNIPIYSHCQKTWTVAIKNSDYEYNFYNDDDMAKFIEENFEDDVIKAYNLLPLGVMRADFWRICVIYIHGGLYVDLDVELVDSDKIDMFFNPDKELILTDEQNQRTFCNWIFSGIPGHPFLKSYINSMKNKVLESNGVRMKDNEHFVHEYTGPNIMTSAALDYFKSIGVYRSEKARDYIRASDLGKISVLDSKLTSKYFPHRFNGQSNKVDGWFRERTKARTYTTEDYEKRLENTKTIVQIRKENDALNNNSIVDGYNIVSFDDNQCRNFIGDNFESEVLKCYDIISPPVYKSDIFRLCYLYINGGIYVNSVCRLSTGLNEMIKKYSLIFVKDKINYRSTNFVQLWNGFIFSRYRYQPFFMIAIKSICRNVNQRIYGENPLDITGSWELGRAMSSLHIDIDKKFLADNFGFAKFDIKSDDNKVILDDHEILVCGNNADDYKEEYKNSWENGRVYNDDNSKFGKDEKINRIFNEQIVVSYKNFSDDPKLNKHIII